MYLLQITVSIFKILFEMGSMLGCGNPQMKKRDTLSKTGKFGDVSVSITIFLMQNV